MAEDNLEDPNADAPASTEDMEFSSVDKQAPAPVAPAADVPNVDDVSKGLGALKKQQNDALEVQAGEQIARLNRDQARAEEAYRKSAGAELKNLKPWDAEAEQQKRQTDPIAAFGSIGSIFGILASAFTRAPMEHALNASASAINAIKEGNAKDYDRSYKAWQDNWKMAMDRQQIQHQAYTDATSLLTTNMAAGDAKMKILAARFGDRQMQYLMENGLSQQAIELIQSRNKMQTEMQLTQPKVWLENAKMSALLKSGYNPANPNSPESVRALQQWNSTWNSKPYDKQLEFSTQFWSENPQATWDQYTDALRTFNRASAGGVLTEGRLQAEAIDKRAKEIMEQAKAAGKPISQSEAFEQAKRQVVSNTGVITANRRDELEGKLDRIVNMERTIDKVEELLKKHKGITGLGGTISRPMEVASNIFGSNETDRKQFQRYISELQEWAPAALNDRGGRPLAAEAEKVKNIVAGLQPGDTLANTARAYKEMRELLYNIKQQLEKRRGSQMQQQGPGPAERKGGNDWYKSAPMKRSAIDEMDENVA